MYHAISGPITASDAQADDEQLFDAPAELPAALVARGWKLIERAPGRLFAVSAVWGCTSTKATIGEVVAEAWGLVGFCEAMNRKRE